MKDVIVYSMNNCPYCTKAKALLTQRGIPYKEINLDERPDNEWEELVQKTKLKTLPQIFAGEKLIGGYTQLAEVDAADQLKSLK